MAKKTNVIINGKDYYRVTATVGTTPDGERIRKQFYGDSKKQSEMRRDEYLTGIKQGLAVNYEKALFSTAFQSWFESVLRPSVSLSTYSRYEIDYRHRIAGCVIANMRLIDIRAANIQAYYNKLLERHSPKTLHAVHKLLHQFFTYCVKSDIITKSPLYAVELPIVERHSDTNKAISDIDIKKLLQAANKDIKYFVYVFAMFTGLREGEILSLAHKDVDLASNTIQVTKTVKFLTVDGVYQPIVGTPKTKQSIRTVPILDSIKQLLQSHIQHEKDKHNNLNIPFSQDSILFSSYACTYREAPNLLKMLKRLCIKLDMQPTTFHSLRHTFCTILAKQSVPLKTASILMGHADIAITARVYTHVDDTEKRKGIEKLSAYFHDEI